MRKTRADGQILVIILLIISILSIFMLSMVSTAKKDSQQTRDNEKYEQFYAIGEQKLILAQNAVGMNQITDVDTLKSWLTSAGLDVLGNCSASPSHCDLVPETYEVGSSDLASISIYFTEGSGLQFFQLDPNSNLKINIIKDTNLYTESLYLYWNDSESQTVDWVITLDYYAVSADPSVPSYKSLKVSTLPALAEPLNGAVPANANFAHGVNINIGQMLASAGVNQGNIATTRPSLRIKPLAASGTSKISISLVPSNETTFPSQFRKIVAVVNSSSSVNTGTSDSPTPVLNLEYPLNNPISPFFDYVFRGGYFDQH